MSELRGIEADFATWRPVQGRKILQLVFEVPIERTQHVLDMLGIPQPGASKWCAIALLNKELVQDQSSSATNTNGRREGLDSAPAQASEAGGSPKKHWSEYARSQQAAILTGDPDFWRYFHCTDQEDAVKRLKAHFRIASRKELDDPQKHGLWDEFVALYHMHRDRLK